VVVNVRQGVHWHDKPPMNGRALTAQDIEYNYHRLLGLGGGFTERTIMPWELLAGANIESVTATDESTVVFKLEKLTLTILPAVLNSFMGWMYPPEVIEEHGDAGDWQNLVGTGPMMLTDRVEGSSVTWVKNPDYWGHDEKYPQNRLPYIDELRALVMIEPATRMAALRTGRVDYERQLRTLEQIEGLQRTNPELVIWPYIRRSDNGVGMNVQVKPFDDIRVRKAMQMALNLEEINDSYYKGYADIIPQGQLSRTSKAVIQFEDWPEEVRKVFTYDPEGAKELLAEAGYSDGFKTTMIHLERYDLNYIQLLASYWKEIGAEVEIDVHSPPSHSAKRSARDFVMTNAEAAGKGQPLGGSARYLTTTGHNSSNVDDPWYNAKFEEAKGASSVDELNSLVKELQLYGVEQFWTIFGPVAPQFAVIQPWVIGYNGEHRLGDGRYNAVFTRVWIDEDLKKEMGY
jgi:peptide/nickel transport system substrate-binding protein